MQNVQMPNGDIVSFPQDMPKEEIRSLIEKRFPEVAREKMARPEGILRGALQGATFGFGDELVAGAGSIPQALITGQSIPEAYGQILEGERQAMDRFREDRPFSAVGSEIGGAIATGIGSLGTKAGAALAGSLGRGGLGARATKGALAGASSGGLYGYGSGEGEERLESARQGALFGGVTGGAFPLAGAALSRATGANISAEQIGNKSRQLYQSARKKGAEFSDDAAQALRKSIQEQITDDDFAKAIVGDDEVSALLRSLDEAQKSKMTLESFEVLDKRLGSQAQQAFTRGDADLSRRLGEIQGDLREIVTNGDFIKGTAEGVKDYREATKLWRSYSKMRDIEEILESAEYYVGGEAAGIKAGFTRLAKNKKKLRGYTKEEVEAIKKAARTGATEGLLRTLGSRLMTIGGAVSGGVPGAIAGQAASSAARAGASALKGADATRVGKIIAQNTGLTPQQSKSLLGRIMQMPPREAQEALRNITQSTSITQGTK